MTPSDREHLETVLKELNKSATWVQEALSGRLNDAELHECVARAFHSTGTVVGILRDVEISTDRSGPFVQTN